MKIFNVKFLIPRRGRTGGLGFTLIELLVVIAILGILATIGVVSFRSTNQRARDSKRQADLQELRSALEIYRADNGGYPDENGDVSAVLNSELTGYISTLPDDPESAQNYQYVGRIGCNGTICKQYRLCAKMETFGVAGDCTINANKCDDSGNYHTCNYMVESPL